MSKISIITMKAHSWVTARLSCILVYTCALPEHCRPTNYKENSPALILCYWHKINEISFTWWHNLFKIDERNWHSGYPCSRCESHSLTKQVQRLNVIIKYSSCNIVTAIHQYNEIEMILSVFILPGLEAIGSNNLFFYFAPWTLQLKIAWVKAIDMQYKYFFFLISILMNMAYL